MNLGALSDLVARLRRHCRAHLGVLSPQGAGSLRWARGTTMSDDGAPLVGRFSRRRRANVEGGRHHRHVVRVTPAEEAQLLQRAGALRVSVPRLLVESALAERGAQTTSERAEVLTRLFALHRLLSGMARNINQMARATNATGEVQADMAATFAAVRRAAERVDAELEAMNQR